MNIRFATVSPILPTFDKIKPGDTFTVPNNKLGKEPPPGTVPHVFIKIRDVRRDVDDDTDEDGYNAVRLTDGNLQYFSEKTTVAQVKTELTIL